MTSTVRLGEVATVERNTCAPEDISSGSYYVGLENIGRGGQLLDVKPVQAGDLASAKFEFTEAHILYGKLRPYLAKIAMPELRGVCSTDILPILPSPRIDRAYLCRYLRQPAMVRLATSRSVGANLPRLSPSELANFEIPLPSIEEQRRSAAVLDQADELRAKRRASLALVDSLTESIFLAMFGDPISNSRGWQRRPLGTLGTLDRGVSKHRPRNDPELMGGPYPLIQTGDVVRSGGYIVDHSSTYSEFGLRQSKLWPAGTLCITIAANIARAGLLMFDGCFPDSVVGFASPTTGMDEYVRWLLHFKQPSLERAASMSAQKNINLKILRELEVPVPQAELIGQFADVVRRLRKQSTASASATNRLDALFASLQHRAFAGQL